MEIKSVRLEKLKEIDQFLKYFPKMNVAEVINNSKNNQKDKNYKLLTNGKGVHKTSSLIEINNKVKEKIQTFNTNSKKNSKIKKQRGKLTKSKNEDLKKEKTVKSDKNIKKNEK